MKIKTMLIISAVNKVKRRKTTNTVSATLNFCKNIFP